MAGFAERIGKRAARSVIQSDDLDDETRNGLWNVTNAVRTQLDDDARRRSSPAGSQLVAAIWAWVFGKPTDEQPADYKIWNVIKETILRGEWIDALDLIEDVVKRLEQFASQSFVDDVTGVYNQIFEQFLVGYRFIGAEITPIDSGADANAVDTAIEDSTSIKGARRHLERAVELLASRQDPDYANSIKESISAVESVCRAVTGEATLGGALKKLKGAGVKIHPALEQAWSKMYGWTSDEDGIRHGGIEAADADQSLAKYVLITCSAFVSHIIESGRKAELI